MTGNRKKKRFNSETITWDTAKDGTVRELCIHVKLDDIIRMALSIKENPKFPDTEITLHGAGWLKTYVEELISYIEYREKYINENS